MFTWLNKQGVRSSTGYILQCMDRFYYHYSEGDHFIKVIREPGIGVVFISLSSIRRWLPPFDQEEIPEPQIQEIQQRISDALNFMGTKHKFE